ncbi:hypothetical protein SAMN05216262_102281 [Colwellia chukchiensis]|uniref:Uncharacterized protein n=1 Tax=Colwellia chukchiensis TaxID=641665 RepID=A0A1H7JLG5_9GAMM|nr:hypothetical protein [Colwellia chukchiensis]SEK75473.1 hypothetical protein SAMN05216262_102281 [Colwellia chukchiensis]
MLYSSSERKSTITAVERKASEPFANVVYMLNFWLDGKMWQSESLFNDIKAAINKLSHAWCEISASESIIIQELSDGLFQATLTAFMNAEQTLQKDINAKLEEIALFQAFLQASANRH